MSVKFNACPTCWEDSLIAAAVEDVRDFDDLTEANRYFERLCNADSDFVKLSNNVYHYKEYFINAGVRVLMAVHASGVMCVANRGISCAPEGMAEIWLNNDSDMVLITRIRGSENRRLIPWRNLKVDAIQMLRQAKLRLFDDVMRLADMGLACAAITDNCDAWYLFEGENRVIISEWRLVELPEKAKPAYFSRVKRLLDIEK